MITGNLAGVLGLDTFMLDLRAKNRNTTFEYKFINKIL